MILHHHQWVLVIVARNVSFFFSRLLLYTQLVKNVIIFRFDQSYEQPMLIHYMYV